MDTFVGEYPETATRVESEELEAANEVYAKDEFDVDNEHEYWVDDDYVHRIEGHVTNIFGEAYDNVTVKGQLYGKKENNPNAHLGEIRLGSDTDELGLLQASKMRLYSLFRTTVLRPRLSRHTLYLLPATALSR